MLQLFISLLKRPKNIVAVVVGSVFIFTLLRMIPQFHIIYDFWKLKGVSLSRKFEIAYDYSFGEYSSWAVGSTTLNILLAFAIMINIIIFISYFKRQQKIFKKRTFLATLSGMFLGMFGVGCLSCGAIVLAPVLTFFGLGAYVQAAAAHALLIASIGLVFIFFSTWYLLKKMMEPQVCT